MNITEIRVDLVEPSSKLRAYVSFVIEDRFVVHGLKVIENPGGRLIVVMPNRKVTLVCPGCQAGGRDFMSGPPVTDNFCGKCGKELPPFEERTAQYATKANGSLDIYRDICHPLDRAMRQEIEEAVLAKYREALCPPTE